MGKYEKNTITEDGQLLLKKRRRIRLRRFGIVIKPNCLSADIARWG